MFRAKVTLIALATATAMTACSTQNWYEGVRQSQVQHCQGLPDSQREACLRGTQDSYEQYKRKREEATQGQTAP